MIGKSSFYATGIPTFTGITVVFFLLFSASVVAADPTPKQKLETCLKKAEDLPDMGEAESTLWIKKGGGPQAQFCHAVAQFNRNEFLAAGDEFAALAKLYDKTDPRHATELHARAGVAYTRADDIKKAEDQYGTALTLEPDDPEIWTDRATERAATEHYWDAISDLDHALSIMPDMAEALRLRGQAWMKLGNTKNALSDFNLAEQIEDADQPKKAQ